MPIDAVHICNDALLRLGAKPITALADASPQGIAATQFYDDTRQEVLRSHPWNFASKRLRISAYPSGTLTPGAVSGTGVTFTASVAVFASSDVGSLLHSAAGGAARIVTFTDTTHVVADVETTFETTGAIANASWWIGPAWGFTYRYAKPSDYLRLMYAENQSVGWSWSRMLTWNNSDMEDPIKVEGDYLVTDIGGTLDILYVFNQTDVSKADPIFRAALSCYLAGKMSYALTQSLAVTKAMLEVYAQTLGQARVFDGQEGTANPLSDTTLIDVRRAG